MLIQKFYIPADEAAGAGLKEINMPRLGRFVALAGKNGAGKSRLLRLLGERISLRESHLNTVNYARAQIKSLQTTIRDNSGRPELPQWKQQLDHHQQILRYATEYVISDEDLRFQALRFVPKLLQLTDPRRVDQTALISSITNVQNIAVEDFGTCFLYIQQMQNRWWNATHQGYSGPQEEKAAQIAQYDKLNVLITTLLGVGLTRSLNGEAELFDRPLSESNLSDGQSVALQLAAALHAKASGLDNTVLILDELENHLHPSVAIELLEKLVAAAPNTQLWIATHSVPLLAYILSLEPMALWYMEGGTVTHAGRQPQRVLRNLLGDDTRIGQLNALTGIPAQLASVNYAVESLAPPAVASAQEQDPQINQVAAVLKGRAVRRPLSVLDYGAGKGRLLEGLAAAYENGRIAEHIDYLAFDSSEGDKATCLAVIAEHFDDCERRYFNSPDEYFSAKDDNSLDVIVMCNVLHEISPSQWLSLFSRTSLIGRSLKSDGFLLIVEDQRIPVGEKAHEHGFLVLDTTQLKTLFGITEPDIQSGKFIFDSQRNGRLKAHLIAKSLLSRITNDSRTEAIEQLLETALDQVRNLRKMEPTYANGQLHGFWTQQLANAYMYVRENI